MKVLLFLCVLFANSFIFSQEKVEWQVLYNSTTKNIEIVADIADGWHLYSQYINPEIGPIPTQFKFKKNSLVSFTGNVVEQESIKELDESFQEILPYFKDKAIFSQNVIFTNPTEVELIISFMVCNNSVCLPPIEKMFKIKLQNN